MTVQRLHPPQLRCVSRHEIAIGKAVALDGRADRDWYAALEHGPGGHERVEFTVLAAGIDGGRQELSWQVDRASLVLAEPWLRRFIVAAELRAARGH